MKEKIKYAKHMLEMMTEEKGFTKADRIMFIVFDICLMPFLMVIIILGSIIFPIYWIYDAFLSGCCLSGKIEVITILLCFSAYLMTRFKD